MYMRTIILNNHFELCIDAVLMLRSYASCMGDVFKDLALKWAWSGNYFSSEQNIA